jgi:N-acetylneuraminate lyase
VYTPFDEDFSLNVSVVPAQAAYLNKTGVKSVLVAGTTGESVKLTTDERKALAEAWSKAGAAYGMRIFVHVGANALDDARELARHAQSIGASGLVSMSTTYFRPSTISQLIAELQFVFSAAPSMPAWYYHIPSMTGVNNFQGFNMFDMLQANNLTSSAAIPNLVGIKFTGEQVATECACPQWSLCRLRHLHFQAVHRLRQRSVQHALRAR